MKYTNAYVWSICLNGPEFHFRVVGRYRFHVPENNVAKFGAGLTEALIWFTFLVKEQILLQ